MWTRNLGVEQKRHNEKNVAGMRNELERLNVTCEYGADTREGIRSMDSETKRNGVPLERRILAEILAR